MLVTQVCDYVPGCLNLGVYSVMYNHVRAMGYYHQHVCGRGSHSKSCYGLILIL